MGPPWSALTAARPVADRAATGTKWRPGGRLLSQGRDEGKPRLGAPPPPLAGEGSSQRYLAVFAVGKARFLQVEVAFDPPPRFVGDLAVAQQHVDEFALGRNQFARQRRPLRRNIVRIGVERIRQLVRADLVPGPQQ